MAYHTKKTSIFIPIIAALLLFGGCKNGTQKKQPLLPSVSGKPGDITLVIDKKHWEGDLGDSIKGIFYQEIYGLPNIEPLYDLMQVTHRSFSNLYKKTRNILMIKIADDHENPDILIQKDLWAKPQTVMSVVARSPEEAIQLMGKKQDRIISVFNDAERKRYRDIIKKSQDKTLKARIQLKHKLDIVIPNGYSMGMDTTNFTWIDNLQPDNITQGLFIYEYEYTDTSTFTRDFLIRKRDEVLRKYVQGSVRGSYMTTEDLLPPAFQEYVLKGEQYIAEIRGLWKMAEGQPMGGPFVSYSLLDEERNRVVTVEGYVFAPGHKKRNLVRQLESILTTIEIVPVNQ